MSSPLPYALHSVRVKRARLISPHTKRLTINASALSGLRADLPGQWFKVFIAKQEEGRPVGRAYTVRHFDPVTHDVDVDFYLHGDTGPVSAWAERVQIGDELQISDVHPRSGYTVRQDVRQYLFFGDETSLPAIAAILECLPENAQAQAYIEIEDAHEELMLSSPASLTVNWLHRSEMPAATGSALLEAARQVSITGPDTMIWVAAESTDVSAIRKHFTREKKVERQQLYAVGYWKRGKADHQEDEES